MKNYILFILLGWITSFSAMADVEPTNNLPGTTTDVLTIGGSQTGSAGVGDNDDYFSLTTSGDGSITISLSNTNNQFMYIYLYDSNGSTQLAATNGSAGSGIQVTANGLAAGNYFVRVFSNSPTDNYTVSASLALQTPANDTEVNDSPAQALPLTLGVPVTGHVGYRYNGGANDNEDYYIFTTTQDGNITVDLSNVNNQYTYIYLYDSDGITLLGSTSGNAQAGIQFTSNGLAAGSYYVRVYGGNAYTGYTLTTTLSPVPVSNDAEPNNSPAQALPFTINSTVNGHIAHRYNGGNYDIDDYYVFTTVADGDITLNLSNTNNLYTYIYLYDNDGVTQLAGTSGSAISGISTIRTGLAAGTYYIRVSASAGQYCGYTLNASLTPEPLSNDPDNNNYFANAPAFAQNDSITGHIAFRRNGGSYDNDDYFSFYSNGDYSINISLRNSNNNYTYIYLYDTDTVTLLGSTSGSAQNGISFTVNGLAAGTYYVRVSGSAGQYAGYVLYNTYTPNPIAADPEPNNNPATAVNAAYNSTMFGHIAYRHPGGTYDTDDYYKIQTPVDGNISVNITNNNNNYTYIYLYDADGVTQIGATSGSAQGGVGFTSSGLAAGTYYIRVSASAGQFTGYTLVSSLTPTAFLTDAEFNDTKDSAVSLSLNSTVNGHIAHRRNGGTYDGDDYYKMILSEDGNIVIDISNSNNNYTYVYFYDSDGITQLAGTSGNAQAGISTSRAGLAAGTYYIRVSGGAGNFTGYTLTNTVTPAVYNNDAESNNSIATASILNNNPSKQGHIYYRFNGGTIDGDDYWKFTVYATDTVTFDITMANNNYSYVYVYNSVGTQIYGNSGNFLSYSLVFNNLTAGDYYLRFSALAYNSYSIDGFQLPCNPDASVITAGGPTTFCSGGSVGLNTTGVYSSYLWSNGATTGGINVTATGDYSLTAFDYDGCAHSSNMIQVTVNPNQTWYIDNDNDQYGSASSVIVDCIQPSGYVTASGDCNDNNSNVNPGVTEICNGQDDDCDGQIDEGCSIFTFFQDLDNDNYGNPNVTTSAFDPIPPTGYVSNSTDCNDNNASVNPGATEVCNSIDDDCDGSIDEGVQLTFYADSDNDNYGDATVTILACIAPSGFVTNSTDCNDNNAAINPGATEVCNSIDDDCDGSIDEGVQLTFYADSDNDNYGDATVSTLACTAPTGYVSNSTDCNDNNASVNPGAPELCNGIDDDCDGVSDEGCSVYTFYFDSDNDTYGNLNNFITISSPVPPSGYVLNFTDCNDANAAVNPGATEICNGIDDDCDGATDEGCSGCSNPPTVFAGNDQSICSGDNVALNATMGGGASSVSWSSNTGGTFMPNSNSATATYLPSATDITNGFVRLYITTDFPSGCNAALDSIDVTILDLMETPGMISGSQYICNPSSGATYTYSVATVPGATGYNWTAGPSASIISGQGTNNITVKFTPSAIHNGINANICVAATGPGSCGVSNTSCLAVSVQAVAPVTPGSISGANKACPGDTIIYSVAFVSRVAYYTWTVPSTASIVEGQGTQIIKVAYGATFNGGTISVAAVNGCGSSPLRSRVILYNTLPAPGTINGQSSGLCNEQNVIYTISPVAGASSYQWTIPAQGSFDGSSNGNSITVDYSSFVNGNVSVAGVNGCGAGVARSLSVSGTPASAGLITGPVVVCAGVTQTYQVATVTGATGYNWTVPSGTTILNGQGTKIIDLKFGNTPAFNQVVSVRTSNACGNGNLRSLGSIATLYCIRNSASSQVEVSPNPSAGIYKVDLLNSSSMEFAIQVMDMSGKLILNTRINNTDNYMLDLSSYEDGLYMLHIQSEEINEMIKLIKN